MPIARPQTELALSRASGANFSYLDGPESTRVPMIADSSITVDEFAVEFGRDSYALAKA